MAGNAEAAVLRAVAGRVADERGSGGKGGGGQPSLPPQACVGSITGMRKREPQVQQTCKARVAQKAGSRAIGTPAPLSPTTDNHSTATVSRATVGKLCRCRDYHHPRAQPPSLCSHLRWALVACWDVGKIAELRCAGKSGARAAPLPRCAGARRMPQSCRRAGPLLVHGKLHYSSMNVSSIIG